MSPTGDCKVHWLLELTLRLARAAEAPSLQLAQEITPTPPGDTANAIDTPKATACERLELLRLIVCAQISKCS